MKKFNKIFLIFILFLFFFILNAYSYANFVSQNLSNTFFRLHILANSNSKEDQILKIKVRDGIIEYMNELIQSENTKEKIQKICEKNKENFKNIAENIILDNGYNYTVNVSIDDFYFPTKNYGNISLPSGVYDALRIEIGNSKGENWWCSLFPPLCFIDVSTGIIDYEGEKYLEKNLSKEEFSIISENSKTVKFKFKIIEILNNKNTQKNML